MKECPILLLPVRNGRKGTWHGGNLPSQDCRADSNEKFLKKRLPEIPETTERNGSRGER